MTGTGIHILDAFVNTGGPVRRRPGAVHVDARRSHDPRDTVSALFRFENGMSGFLGAGAAVAFLLARARIRRCRIGRSDRRNRGRRARRVARSSAANSLRSIRCSHEFDAFADAVAGRAPYPITPAEMVDTIGGVRGRSLASMEHRRAGASRICKTRAESCADVSDG